MSNQHRNVIDYAGDGVVHGHGLHGRKNQQWIFEAAGGGYAIASHAVNPPAEGDRRYLGLSPNDWSDNSRLVLVGEKYRVIWTVQPAKGNTFRCVRLQRNNFELMNLRSIARMDHPNWCFQMPWAGNGAPIAIFSHVANAMHQRWELVLPSDEI